MSKIKYADHAQFISENCKCCVTEKPMKDSKHITVVQLSFKASWKFPVWGNFIHGLPPQMAMAYIHDDAVKDGKLIAPVKFAVEIVDDQIIYHPVPACRKCGCTDDHCPNCMEKLGKPCVWVEPDLCSACV